MEALGMMETKGLVGAIEAADAMVLALQEVRTKVEKAWAAWQKYRAFHNKLTRLWSAWVPPRASIHSIWPS